MGNKAPRRGPGIVWWCRFLLVLLLAITGCNTSLPLARRADPGSPPPVGADTGPGTLRFSVQWPQRDLPGFHAQQIPLSTNALVVTVSDEQGKPAGTNLLRRPVGNAAAGADGELKLSRGNYSLVAEAFRELTPGADSVPVARGNALNLVVRSGRTSTVTVPLTALFAPLLTHLSAGNGAVGQRLTIAGQHLWAAGHAAVYFNGAVQPDNSVTGLLGTIGDGSSEDALQVTVPAGARSGNIVVVADGIPSASVAAFNVLKALDIAAPRTTLGLGETAVFAAAGVDTEGQRIDQVTVTWSSSDQGAGTIDASGRFSASQAGGLTIIRAVDASGNLVGTVPIAVRFTGSAFSSFDYFHASTVRGLFAATVNGGRTIYAVGIDGTTRSSTDKGGSWQLFAPGPANISVTDAAADPTPGNLYIGTQGGIFYYTPTGVTGAWVQVGPGPVGNMALPICAIASDAINVYAGLFDGTVWRTPVSSLGPTSTWIQVGSAPVQAGRSIYRLRIVGGQLYAALGSALLTGLGRLSGLTALLGASNSNVWQTPLVGNNNSVWGPVGAGAPDGFTSIFSLIDDGTYLYAGSASSFYYTVAAGSGAGSVWTPLGPALAAGNNQLTAWSVAATQGAAAAEQVIGAVGSNEVFTSAAPGLAGAGAWATLGTVAATREDVVIALLAEGGDLYAGTATGRVFRRSPGGSWVLPNGAVALGAVEPVSGLATDGQRLFAGGPGGLASRSLDAGDNWTRLTIGNLSLNTFVAAAGELYAAFAGVYVARLSTDQLGYAPAVPLDQTNPSVRQTRSLLVAGDKVYAGSDDGTIWQWPRTSSGSWTAVGPAMAPNFPVKALAQDGMWLYAGNAAGQIGRTQLANTGPGSLMEQVGAPLGAGAVNSLLAQDGRLYVGCADGSVYAYDTLHGGVWTHLGGGQVAGGAAVQALASDRVVLFAGTTGKGAYRIPLAGGSWEAIGGPDLANATITGLIFQGNQVFISTDNQGIFRGS